VSAAVQQPGGRIDHLDGGFGDRLRDRGTMKSWACCMAAMFIAAVLSCRFGDIDRPGELRDEPATEHRADRTTGAAVRCQPNSCQSPARPGLRDVDELVAAFGECAEVGVELRAHDAGLEAGARGDLPHLEAEATSQADISS
jgi:hypothetical protein